MPVDHKRTRSLFLKLGRIAQRLAAEPRPEDVHQFRTTTRRIEALFQEVVRDPDRKQRKLLKQLAKIRKRAGRVRDLDVQISALRALTLGRDGQDKHALIAALSTERAKYEKKLVSALSKDDLHDLRKRLRRAADDDRLYDTRCDPVAAALSKFAVLARRHQEVNEATLHPYRLQCKRIRYLAEMAGKQPEAAAVVQQLKAIQDAAGEWHDWDNLTARAETLFAERPNAPLLAALRAVRHSKLVEALQVTGASKEALLQMAAVSRPKPVRSAPAGKRHVAPPSLTAAATA